jgi:hypothetical protein
VTLLAGSRLGPYEVLSPPGRGEFKKEFKESSKDARRRFGILKDEI